MTDISELVKSEISDFCAGLESPGCPETSEEIQRELMDRILPLIKDARQEWMSRGIVSWICSRDGRWNATTVEAQKFANKIRSGEVDL